MLPANRQIADRCATPPPAPAGRGRVLLPLGALVFYCAITALYAIGSGGQLRSEFIGDGGDNWEFVWNAWWIKRCLLTWANPYYCPLQFAPGGAPLTMHNLALIPTLAMIALDSFVSMPLAYNLTALSFFPLAGMCAYALARYITRDYPGALAGGALFMLCPFLTSKTLGHFNLLSAAFLPLYVLCLLRVLDRQTGRVPLTLVFLLIVFSNEHTLVFAANVTVWLWIFRAWSSRQWRAELAKFWWALKPALLFSLIWVMFLGYYAVRYGAVPYRTGALAYCPEPLNFVLPIFPTSWWRERITPAGLDSHLGGVELSVYLGWLALPLSLAGYWRLRDRPLTKFMGLMFICSLVLALGPKLQWNRHALSAFHLPIYLPAALYRFVPVLGSIGQTGRYLLIGYMAMSVALAGLVCWVRGCHGTATAAAAVVLIVALVGIDYGYRLPFVAAPACPIPPGNAPVMDVRQNPALALYLQTIHGRPLVGGYLARWPIGAFDRYQATPGVAWFFTSTKKRETPPAGDEIRSGLRALSVEYVCSDPTGVERKALETAKLELVYEDRLGATFHVPP